MSNFLDDFGRVLTGLPGAVGAGSVIVAVSGGLDSMVLLHALHRLSALTRWSLEVAHYNHQLRGPESDADEDWVRRTALKLGLPCQADTGDVRAHAATKGISIEMAARELRYLFLGGLAAQRSARFILTAHHSDDQVEHLWLRLLRGVEGHGLELMKPLASVPGLPVPLLRPLLAFTRESLLEWARAEGIAWREDSSNADESIPRNWVRHRLLPTLAEGASLPVSELTHRFGTFLGEQLDAVRSSAQEWLANPDAKPWLSLPPAIRKEAVRIRLLEAGLQTTRAVVAALAGRIGTSVSVWSSDGSLRSATWDARQGGLVIAPQTSLDMEHRSECLRVDLGSAGRITFAGRLFSWSSLPPGSSKPTASPAFLDAHTLISPCAFRHWQPGDRFHKLGMAGEAKLQDLFVNAGVPAVERRHLVLIENGDGRIIWAERLGVSHPTRVSPQTQRVLQLSWQVPACPSPLGP